MTGQATAAAARLPANRMPYSGLPDARERADLIVYMQQVFKQEAVSK